MSSNNKLYRIKDRFPRFYSTEENTTLHGILETITFELENLDNDILETMKSHWVDTAYGSDLDRIGSFFKLKRINKEPDENYRRRIKFLVSGFIAGGTVEFIRGQIKEYLNLSEKPIMIENPRTEQSLNIRKQKSNNNKKGTDDEIRYADKWSIRSLSISDEKFNLAFEIEDGDYELSGLTVTDTVSGMSICYKGALRSGQRLVIISDGKAQIDGSDVSENLLFEDFKILRKGSTWEFTESVSPIMGRFDESEFDKNIFDRYVPFTRIEVRWTASLLSSFELKIPKREFQSSGVSMDELSDMMESIKATGVKTIINIFD